MHIFRDPNHCDPYIKCVHMKYVAAPKTTPTQSAIHLLRNPLNARIGHPDH